MDKDVARSTNLSRLPPFQALSSGRTVQYTGGGHGTWYMVVWLCVVPVLLPVNWLIQMEVLLLWFLGC